MPNVWSVKQPLRDVAELQPLGDVCVVYPSGLSPIDVEGQERIIVEDVLKASSKNDLVLMQGPTLMVSLLTMRLCEHHGRVKVVVWDRRRSRWIVRTLSAKGPTLQPTSDMV